MMLYYVRKIADDYTYYHFSGMFDADVFGGSSYDTEAEARKNIRLLKQSDRVNGRPEVVYDVICVIELDKRRKELAKL